MNSRPEFNFFLARKEDRITKGTDIWSAPLPIKRRPVETDFHAFVSYGDYFTAVQAFFQKNDLNILLSAASLQTSKKISAEDIEKIDVFLEKHGEFYHPSRIEMFHGDQKIRFVLNVAVSDTGKNYIEKEYRALQKLNQKLPLGFVPEVYDKGEADIIDGNKIQMFLGQWFDGYHEFHISGDPDKIKKIVVWDPEQGSYFLSSDQIQSLYKQAAFILTGYYNTETFEQIYPWHHAAGDFVLKQQNGKIDLKLITVRQYRSFGEDDDKKNQDPAAILEALLVFFLNLSIRMRLDRIDGVGEIVWADDTAVEGIVEGFFSALALKPPVKSISIPIDDCFGFYLTSQYAESDIYALAMDIASAYPPESPEFPIIKKNMKKHVHDLLQKNHSFFVDKK